MSTTIVVAKTTKEIKAQKSGEKYWGVEDANTGQWFNVFTVEQPLKGQTLVLDVNESEYKGKTYRWSKLLAKPGGAPQQQTKTDPKEEWEPPADKPKQNNGGRQTPYTQSWDTYQDLAKRAHTLALELEPGTEDARARMAFVSTCLMALGDGKLTLGTALETLEAVDKDPWDTETAAGGSVDSKSKVNGRVKQEKSAAHDHLTQVLGEAVQVTGKDTLTLLLQHGPDSDAETGVVNVLCLTEKEAIQTRLSLEKLIDEKTDWRAKLTIDIKEYCNRTGIDFQKEKVDILKSVAGTAVFSDVNQDLAKKACGVLKQEYTDKLS